jgi:hypothetical protein
MGEMGIKNFRVVYDKKGGEVGEIVVKAVSEADAVKNAKALCFGGKNFRDALEVDEGAHSAHSHHKK